jgi:hypothetical protein
MFAEVDQNRIQKQQSLYHTYALAAEDYSKIPNLDNWDKKEKALENYNAFIRDSLREAS